MFGPKTAIPALIPVVPAAPPNVSVSVPARLPAVVVAVTGDPGTTANVISDPLGTSPNTAALSTTVLGATLRAVVPAAMLGPKTAIPALIPVVPPKASVVPDGQSAVVAAVTGGSARLNTSSAEAGTGPETAALSVTAALGTVATLCTVAPGGMFWPETAVAALIPLPAVPANISMAPDGQSVLVAAVVDGPGGPVKVITVPAGTSPPTLVLSVT
jgi:hypothetical protein